jgi:hypothetical protein
MADTLARQPSVILIRVQSLGHKDMAQLILRIIHRVEDELPRGIAVTATDRALRLRRLPLK